VKILTSKETSGDLLSDKQREAHEEAVRLLKEEKLAAREALAAQRAAASKSE